MIGVSFSFEAAKGELESGLAFLDVDMGGQAADPPQECVVTDSSDGRCAWLLFGIGEAVRRC